MTAMIDYRDLIYLGLTSPQGWDSLEATRRTDSPFSFVVDFQSTNPSEQWKRLVESWINNHHSCQITVSHSHCQNIYRDDGSRNQEKLNEMTQWWIELSEIVYSKGRNRVQTLSEIRKTLDSFPHIFPVGSALDIASIGSDIGNIQLLLRTPSKSKYGWTNLVLNIRVIK